MANSPSTLNYYIGKGEVFTKKDSDPDFVHVGNVPEFEFTPNIEQLDHFSSQSGVRTKDRTIVLEKSATLRMVMEEWTGRNLSLALIGDVDTDSEGREVIDIFSSNAVSCQVKFVGTNEVGPRFEILLNKVDFLPGSSVNFISEEWGQLEVNGEVAAVNGSFGTMTKLAEEGEEESEA